ncbi:MAG: hypothetical protein HDS30_00950 [Bacteroides sp.]|nr:hypothetical protein [Bacteroides sp.]
MIEHYSSRIQNAIQRELFKATQSIKLAVAWFTNDLLFQPLLLKLAQGVSVEVILNDDVINRTGENSLDFSVFVQNGGILRWNSSDRLMHDKFCIIDDEIVIFGSYNWTFKAEFNEESITIAKNERSTLDFYQKKFSKLSLRYSSEEQEINQRQFSQERANGCEQERSLQASKFVPYHSLNFYDHLELPTAVPDEIRYYFAWVGEWNYRKYYILDEISFLPIKGIQFEEYCLIKRDNQKRNIWIKVDGKWGLYNIPHSEFVIKPQYESVSPGRYDQNTMFAVKKSGFMGVVDGNGRECIPCVYSKAYVCTESWIELEKKGKKGIWSNGRMVFECKYDELWTDGELPSKLNGKFGLVHGSKVILPFEYDEIKYIEPFGIKIHYMRKNGKWGGHLTADLHRKEKFVPCEYYSKDEVDKLLDW